MNMTLWGTGGSLGQSGRWQHLTSGSAALGGLQRVAERASLRRAARRVSLTVEGETERRWFWRLVRLEVERARRSEQPFTVLSLAGVDARAAAVLADRLAPHLRSTDAVCSHDERTLVLLADTAGEAANLAADRLADVVDGLFDEVEMTAVCFPTDVITMAALVDELLDPTPRLPTKLAG